MAGDLGALKGPGLGLVSGPILSVDRALGAGDLHPPDPAVFYRERGLGSDEERLGLGVRDPGQVADELLHQGQEVRPDGEIAPLPIEGAGEQGHPAPLHHLGEQEGRAFIQAHHHLAAGVRGGIEQHVAPDLRPAEAGGGRIRQVGQDGVGPVEHREVGGAPIAALGAGGGVAGLAHPAQGAGEQVGQAHVGHVWIHLLAHGEQQAAAASHEGLKGPGLLLGQIDVVGQDHHVELVEIVSIQRVGGGGGDPDAGAAGHGRGQGFLEVEQLVPVGRGPRIAVDGEHADLRRGLEPERPTIVHGEVVRGQGHLGLDGHLARGAGVEGLGLLPAGGQGDEAPDGGLALDVEADGQPLYGLVAEVGHPGVHPPLAGAQLRGGAHLHVEDGVVRGRGALGHVEGEQLDGAALRRRGRLRQGAAGPRGGGEHHHPAPAVARGLLQQLVGLGHGVGEGAGAVAGLHVIQGPPGGVEILGQLAHRRDHGVPGDDDAGLAGAAEGVEDLPRLEPGLVQQRLAVEQVAHGVRGVHHDHGAAAALARGGEGVAVPAEVRPRQGEGQQAHEQAADQHQQELLDAEAPGGLLLRSPDELQGREAHRLGLAAVDQVDDRRDGRRQQPDQEQRGEEAHGRGPSWRPGPARKRSRARSGGVSVETRL